MYLFWHREFAKSYVPQVKKAVSDFMLNSPEATIKNVKKETIEAIVHKLNDLLKRSLTWEEREKTISELNLNIAIMCLKSQNLERRIHGIKVIDDIIKEMKYQSSFNTSNFTST